jgi:hypothetical protein
MAIGGKSLAQREHLLTSCSTRLCSVVRSFGSSTSRVGHSYEETVLSLPSLGKTFGKLALRLLQFLQAMSIAAVSSGSLL